MSPNTHLSAAAAALAAPGARSKNRSTLARIGVGTLLAAALPLLGVGCDAAAPLEEEAAAGPAAAESVDAVRRASSSGSKFGTLCQKDYQGGWLDSLPYSYDRCQGFVDELSDTDTSVFYYNLKQEKDFLETARDQDRAEKVDLLFLSTHGSVSGDTARFSMYESMTRALTKSMKLGDESQRLSILSGYACDTMAGTDAQLIQRWKPAYAGGLRYVTGAWDLLWDSPTTDEVGEDYADNLQDNIPLQDAWSDAVSDWATEQHPAIQATGSTWNECLSRKKNMKWKNYSSYARLAGASVKYYCGHRWTN